jgi:hypothetical protein
LEWGHPLKYRAGQAKLLGIALAGLRDSAQNS